MSKEENKTVKITLPDSGDEVKLKTSLTWGEEQELQSILEGGAKFGQTKDDIAFSGNVLMETRYRLLETVIVGVKLKDTDKYIEFTRPWMNELSVKDGNNVFGEVEKITEFFADQGKKK